MAETHWIVAGLLALAVLTYPTQGGWTRARWGRARLGDVPRRIPERILKFALGEVGLRRVRGLVTSCRGGRAGSPFGRSVGSEAADFAELVTVGLDAGLSLEGAVDLAVGVAGPVAGRTRHVDFGGLSAGGGAGAGITAVAGVPSADLDFVAKVLLVSERTGAPASSAMRLAASLLRERETSRMKVRSVMAGPKASMILLTALPFLGPLGALLVGLPLGQLYSGVGAVVAALGVLFTLVGWLWARTLLSRAQKPAALKGGVR